MVVYSVLFHRVMENEGQQHSWITGFYWTLTVMTTLGFGDITFHSDLGRLFSMIVLLSGVLFLLIILPFTFIQFFYAPWIEAESKSIAPRQLPLSTKDHIILVSTDAVTSSLVGKLNAYKWEYVILLDEIAKSLELYDQGYRVALGNLDDPDTFRNMRIQNAKMIVALGSDEDNTNIVSTVREVSEKITVVAKADSDNSEDILSLAGSNHVLNLMKMLGESLARRTISGTKRVSIITTMHGLMIAEAPAAGSRLVGRKLRKSGIREETDVTIVGIWERGAFIVPHPDTIITAGAVLVMAGSEKNLKRFDAAYPAKQIKAAPVVILGAGRVGKACAEALDMRKIDYRVVESSPNRFIDSKRLITGNAADIDVLHRAGINEAPTIIITTNNDSTNIYLTIYCRKLCPDAHIICRATLERNVSTLHRAGADIVISYASLGAQAIFNLLEREQVFMLAEGLNVFRVSVPAGLAGKKIMESRIREKTGCSIIAIDQDHNILHPGPELILNSGQHMILIGTVESESLFMKSFG